VLEAVEVLDVVCAGKNRGLWAGVDAKCGSTGLHEDLRPIWRISPMPGTEHAAQAARALAT